MENLPRSKLTRNYKKCCVCSKRRIPGSNVHLNRLPLDPERCRLWVKAIGQDDLVYLPLEKLHCLKFVCNIHFQPGDFKESSGRLLKQAVPTLHLPLRPLKDDLFSDFPLHIGQYSRHGTACANRKVINLPSPQPDVDLDVPDFQDIHADADEPEQNQFDPKDDVETEENQCVPEDDAETEGNQFSWQKANKICIDDDDNTDGDDKKCVQLDTTESKVKDEPIEEVNDEDHKEYICDGCSTNIVGFRYKCVQCDNYDLCQTCEGKMFHAFHYMLRIPKPKPYNEIKTIIEAVREKIKELRGELLENSIEFEEIKLEPEFEDPSADPLRATPRPETPQIATSQVEADTRPTHIDPSSLKTPQKIPLKPMPQIQIPLKTTPTQQTPPKAVRQIQIPLKVTPELQKTLKTTPRILIRKKTTLPIQRSQLATSQPQILLNATLQKQTPVKATPQLQKPFITKSPAAVPQMSKQRSDITHTATQRNEELKTAPVKDTRQIPKPPSIQVDPMDLLNKLKLIKDKSENIQNNDGQTRKRKLNDYIEEDFDKEDVYSTADVEETWLDEEILDDELTFINELNKDNEESQSRTLRNTRNENPRYTEQEDEILEETVTAEHLPSA